MVNFLFIPLYITNTIITIIIIIITIYRNYKEQKVQNNNYISSSLANSVFFGASLVITYTIKRLFLKMATIFWTSTRKSINKEMLFSNQRDIKEIKCNLGLRFLLSTFSSTSTLIFFPSIVDIVRLHERSFFEITNSDWECLKFSPHIMITKMESVTDELYPSLTPQVGQHGPMPDVILFCGENLILTYLLDTKISGQAHHS